MTVSELIEQLKKIPDKSIACLIDCPHCGKGNELRAMTEMVVLGTKAGKS